MKKNKKFKLLMGIGDWGLGKIKNKEYMLIRTRDATRLL